MNASGMSIIVKTVARWLKGFILLYGIYIVLNGHLTPGGGFAGGVIIACGFILLTLAGGEVYGLTFFSRRMSSTLDSVGLLAFVTIAWMATWWASGVFFQNVIPTPADAQFSLFSGGTIMASNMALGLKVASSLFLVFTVMAALRLVGGPDDGPDEEEGEA